MGKTNTDSDALYGIRDAIIKLNSGIIESRQRFIVTFSEIDDQITGYLRRKENELDNKKNYGGSEEGRTDSFCCSKCGGRIMLKILGDETRCRESGCDGIARRVYTNGDYKKSKIEKQRIKEEIEYAKLIRSRINAIAERICSLLDVNSSSGSNNESAVGAMSRWISLLEAYDSIKISDEDKTLKKNVM